ncbi:MAG: DUF2063 domain-containing protein [Silanimonas sp.]|nr:MAG: DUF2063 domain-containing protein [Silanimonas sp.]
MAAASAPRSTLSGLATALLDPAVAAPPRFDVHRNTVMSSLVRALAEGFPSIERLVGPEFFSAMATEFVRRRPPSHPVLLAYGAGFAEFLEGFGPVAALPYLADVARLDGLRRRAWHAADVPALSVASLSNTDLDALAMRRIALHPSVGLHGSPFPARTLWAMQNGTDVPDRLVWNTEITLVRRDGHAIRVEPIDDAVRSLLDTARHAPTLGELLDPGCDSLAPTRAAAFAQSLRDGLLVDAEARDRAMAVVPDAALFDGFLPPFPTAFHDETPP